MIKPIPQPRGPGELTNFANWESLMRDRGVYPVDYGADGGGNQDATKLLQALINDGRRILDDGTSIYKVTSSLVAPAPGTPLILTGNLRLRPSGAFTCLTDSGTQTASTTMTGAHRVNANSFTVTSAAGMSVGDLVEIKSNQNWPFNHESGTVKKGEWTKIAGISGTTITPATPLLCDYDTASETVTVKTYTPNVAIIDGLEIVYSTPTSAVGLGLDYLDGASSFLRNITIQGATLAGISLQQCYGVEVVNPKLINCYESGFGYGIQFNGCTDSHVKGGYSYRARHGVDFSGGYPSHLCSVRGMHVLGHRDEGSCLSTHGGANRSTFSDNILVGGPIGVQIRSPNTIVHDNVFGGHTSNFVTLAGAPGVSVQGNVHFLRHAGSTISANDGYFMEVSVGTNAGATEDNTLYGFSNTEFVVKDNVWNGLTDFLLLGSGITKLEYWNIQGNDVAITNNSGGTNISFLNATSAATINSSSVYGPNHVRNITGTYTELRNITMNGAGSGGNTTQYFSTAPIMSSLTASLPVFTDANKALASNAMTGTGNVVMSASPTGTGTWVLASLTASGTVVVTGLITANGGLLINGGSFASGRLVRTEDVGVLIAGQTGTGATTYDLLLASAAGGSLLANPTGTNQVLFPNSAGVEVDGVLTADGGITMGDADNIVVNTSTGTKIGTATSQKLSLWNKTPIIQPAHADQAALASQNQSALTDSTTGTADTTVADVGAAFSQATLNNNFADLIAQINNARTDIANLRTLVAAMRTAMVDFGSMKGAA